MNAIVRTISQQSATPVCLGSGLGPAGRPGMT